MSQRDCSGVFAILSEYLDRELPEADCAELEKHIQECAPCVAFVDSLKRSVVAGRNFQPCSDVPELRPEVKQSLREAYEKVLAGRKK